MYNQIKRLPKCNRTCKKIKRAIALSGGGPPVGLQVGALKALDENNIHFDVFSTDCIGSWTAAVYKSHEETVRIQRLEDFYRQIFVPDDVFDGLSIPFDIFVTDYFRDTLNFIEQLWNPKTYKGLLLPDRLLEYVFHYANPLNYPKSMTEASLMWNKGVALNPLMRLMFKLQYLTENKTGRSVLLGPETFGSDFVSKYIDFEKIMGIKELIYLNCFNLDTKTSQLFVNRLNHSKYQSITLNILKAQSSILGYNENFIHDGFRMCEGAVSEVLNLNHLLDNCSDVDEVWIMKILDYEEIKAPKNQLEADLLAVELPFITIADSNLKLFKYRLKERGLQERIKVVEIDVNFNELNFFWKQSTLKKGIEVGYQGAIETIRKYTEKRKFDEKG